jgi:predicted transglutaminase-like cysteine proteinase
MRNSALDLSRVACPLLAALALLSPGCTPRNLPEARASFRYFERPDPYDAWSFKISQWQSRQRAETEAGPLEAAGGTLRDRYLQRRTELRRELAQQVATWIQEEAKLYYTEDMLIDHWPTLGEVLVAEADDCDGLELLVQQLLLDLGFPGDQVYRAVVRRPSDDQHHMVTLWFESPDDPWVIDPTGAMVLGLRRMSEVPGWVPLKLFSSTEEFTVRQAFRTP